MKKKEEDWSELDRVWSSTPMPIFLFLFKKKKRKAMRNKICDKQQVLYCLSPLSFPSHFLLTLFYFLIKYILSLKKIIFSLKYSFGSLSYFLNSFLSFNFKRFILVSLCMKRYIFWSLPPLSPITTLTTSYLAVNNS